MFEPVLARALEPIGIKNVSDGDPVFIYDFVSTDEGVMAIVTNEKGDVLEMPISMIYIKDEII